MMASFANGDAALQEQLANLVDHRGAAHNPPLAHSVQRLQVELIVGLDRHEAHRRAAYSLGTRFGIDVIVLVRLHVRLHILCRHQARIMPLFPQSAAQKMRSSAGLHADQALAKVRCETKKLKTRALFANYNFTTCGDADKMKDRLPKIDTDCADIHGTPPLFTSIPSRG